MSGPPVPRAAARLEGVTSTIFAEMSALAVSTAAINLGQGFPDESGPREVVDEVTAQMLAGRNQYPPGHGAPELLDAVIRHQQRHYDINLEVDQVVVTTGATEAIAAALLGLVDPGDEVVVLEPFYDSYRAMIQFAGGVRRPVLLRAPDFRLDPEALRAAISPQTKLMLINTPHNPTGTVLNAEERQAVADLAIEHDLVVVTDEVYEHLTFDEHQHVPLSTLPGMSERTVSISSAGKTFSFTGWKVGWVSGPADLVAAVEGAKNWLTYSSGAPLQPAIAKALNEYDGFHQALRQELQHKRDLMTTALDEIGFDVRVPEGTYFITTDIRPLGASDGHEFCQRMAREVGVVAIPSAAFYDDLSEGAPLVRWAFCKQESVLLEGLERLRRL